MSERTDTDVTATNVVELRSPAGRAVLVATIAGSGMALLDSTIVNVATRRIGSDFNAGFGALQWVSNGYLLPLSSLILLGGSLGDRLGRRRIFLIGVVWFALASLLCAIAPSVEFLIAARALQGIGGALLTPGSLSIITASIAGVDRARAVGLWSGLGGVTTAIGPLLGGWLVQHASWRWAFGLNLPVAALVVYFALRRVPETRSPTPARLDVPGTILIILALAGLTVGATEAGTHGWTATSIAEVAGGFVLLAVFAVLESRSRHPLVPPTLFANRTFTGTNVMTFFTYGALGVVLFVLVLQLQTSAGYGPLAAGLATVPITIMMMLLSPRSAALSARIGARLPLIIGPLLAAAGLAVTLRIDAHHSAYVFYVLPGVVLFGLGLVALVAPLTATVMSAAPADEVGIASGVNNAVARTGSLLAVAALPPLAGLTGTAYEHAGPMTHGYRFVAIAAIALLMLGALVVALTVKNPSHQPAGEATDG